MSPDSEPLVLDDEEYRAVRAFVAEYCGIQFGDDSRFILEKRLRQRLQASQIGRVREYLAYLKWDPNGEAELRTLIDSLTTNETYFYREDYQLRAFTEEIVPGLMTTDGLRGDKTLRVWSAGCSSGEEPYTIAILLAESGIPEGWQVELYAADINQTVLTKARRGIFRPSSFRAMPDLVKGRYFEESDDGSFRIRDEIRASVTFLRLNLLDPRLPEILPGIDVIFCRNVIMYFHSEAKQAVIDRFYQVLDPGGYLLLGHSESLRQLSPLFDLVHLQNDMVYRKTLT